MFHGRSAAYHYVVTDQILHIESRADFPCPWTSGINNWTCWFITAVGAYITTVINSSLEQEAVAGWSKTGGLYVPPARLKTVTAQKHALVTPLLKKIGLDTSSMANFRPGSNFSFSLCQRWLRRSYLGSWTNISLTRVCYHVTSRLTGNAIRLRQPC